MRIFLSAGEPSGDLHGANLIQHLRRQCPAIDCVGFGGERMQGAGGRLLYPLSGLAVMGLMPVLAHTATFLDLIARSDRFFRHHRPRAVVLIDYPGFNWWLARRAHHHGIPVFWFVPPQLWAWASWRVRKMRHLVDHVLCTLPFERDWYEARHVPATYIGHPYFDELSQQQLDAAFLAEQRARGGHVVGLLPGSRTQEVQRNLATLLATAQRIRASRPETRFLIAAFKTAHQQVIQQGLANASLPIEVHVGRTAEIIELSQACVAASGSVGLEMLYRLKPAAVVYRVSRFDLQLVRLLMTSRFISLVNLLADKELYPEFLTDRSADEAIAAHVLGWLNDPAARGTVIEELRALRDRVAQPGACARAAQYILDNLTKHAAA